MLSVNNISKSFGLDLILDGISFSLNSGECLGLVGPNGSGKTTLLRILVQQEKADSGSVQIEPADTRVGYLPQGFSPSKTCSEEKAGQMGFSAYALAGNQDDPLAKAIHGLLDHAVETDRRIDILRKQLEEKGVCVEDELATADKFDPKYLGKIVD